MSKTVAGGQITNNQIFKDKRKVVLLNTAADVIKYFKGEIPDYSETKIKILKDDVRVTKELYLKALQLMEEAKHIH